MKLTSKRFTFNKADFLYWGKQALVFAAPALIVLIGSTVEVLPKDWKYAAVVLWVLNRLTSLLQLYVQGK